MKTSTVVLLGSLTLLVGLGPFSVWPAAGQETGFYFTGGIGPAIAQDVDLKDFLGATGGDVELDPGVHLGVAGGYNFTRWLGVEMESGFMMNNIDRIGDTSPDATLTHVPFLANIVLRYDDQRCPVVPYFTAGLGGDSSVLWIDDSLGVDGSDSDVVFAFQLSAGMRYRINETMSAGLSYKFYHADDASWDVEDTAGRIRFGDATVHCITAVFNMSF